MRPQQQQTAINDELIFCHVKHNCIHSFRLLITGTSTKNLGRRFSLEVLAAFLVYLLMETTKKKLTSKIAKRRALKTYKRSCLSQSSKHYPTRYFERVHSSEYQVYFRCIKTKLNTQLNLIQPKYAKVKFLPADGAFHVCIFPWPAASVYL